jgi:hypothetical protein
MPKINHQSIGDILSYEYRQGIIISIDTNTDSCVVSVDGVNLTALIFYH